MSFNPSMNPLVPFPPLPPTPPSGRPTDLDFLSPLSEEEGVVKLQMEDPTEGSMFVPSSGSVYTAVEGAKTYADEQDKVTLESAKTYAGEQDTTTLESAKTYADEQDKVTLESAKTYAGEQDKTTLESAKTYAGDQDKATLTSAKTYADEQDAATLKSANATAGAKAAYALTTAEDYAATGDKATLASAKSYADACDATTLESAKKYADAAAQKSLRYKGHVKTYEDLLKIENPVQGDMWNVDDEGANYAWTGTEWDKLSETVDLSGLVTKTTTVNGKALEKDITLYGTDIKAKEGSTATIQEAALDDAISAIKKYGEETYAFGDGTTPDEFSPCRYFILSSSKITDSTISSISVTAPKAVSYSSPIRLVLWTWEKVGQVMNPPKFLGYSSDSYLQSPSEVATWSFNGISLPKGAGLVVQGVPDDVTIDDSWTDLSAWIDKASAYAVLAVEAVEVEDKDCAVVEENSEHIGLEAHCSITAVPRSGQTVGGLAADVASLTTTVANKANTADVIVRGTNYENPSITLYSGKKKEMGGVSSSFSVSGVRVMTTSGPGTSTIEDVDKAYRAGTISDIRGIGSLIKESTLADIETAATHTYTFGVNGSSSDKYAKSLYAILSPLLLPYGTVKSVALMASDNVVVSGAKYMLLWAHDGSGSYSSSTCTFLGKSVEAVEQTASTLSTWRFEDVTLPKDRGLIIQLVPEDAAPSGDAWEWGADSGRFEVMSCKCQHGVYGNIINSNWKFNYNFIPYCEVTAATKPTAGKILTGNNVSETSLVGQTDAYAPVTRSGANTLKVDVAGLSPYSTEAGHYGVVAVCSTASGYQKMNLGQSALADNSKELVILKPNQNGTHPGVVSPSATEIPADTVECPTVISGDKATIKAYAPKETDPKFTAWKEDTNIVAGLDVSMPDDITASVAIGDSAMIDDASEGAMALGGQAESHGNYSSAIGFDAYVEESKAIGFAQAPSAIYLNSKTSKLGKGARTLQFYLDERAIKTDVVWTGAASGFNSGYMKTEGGVDPMIVSGGTGSIFFSDDTTCEESTLIPDGSNVVTKRILDAQGYATKSDLKMTVTISNVNTSASEYIVDMTQEDTIALTANVDNTPRFEIKLPLPDPNKEDAAAYTFSGIKRLMIYAVKPFKILSIYHSPDPLVTDAYTFFELDSDGNQKDIRNETFENCAVLIEMIPAGRVFTDGLGGCSWFVRWSKYGQNVGV